MDSNLFKGIFDSELATVIGVGDFLICVGLSLLLGLVTALVYTYSTRSSRSFAVTLAMLPAAVCVVIMLVNGNVGTGVAVAGAFSLVRFRSVPGTAKEICIIFTAMGIGLICGMGYLAFAVLFTLIMCGAFFVYNLIGFGGAREDRQRTLNITIPEDINYTEVFDDILAEFTSARELVRVKTTNMGSMFKLTYNVTLRDMKREKEFIDAIRCRNGNLEVSICQRENVVAEL